MGEETKIQWTDRTFNPWIGCAKVAPGCANCYAEADMAIRRKRVVWGVNGTRSVTSDAYWRQPIKWNREAEASGVRRKVFCASLADVFEDRPEVETWRLGLFELIDETPWLDWLLLTKRPERILDFWPSRSGYEYIPEAGRMNEYSEFHRSNVWLGTSISDQETADKAISELLKCRDLSPILFLSCEPLIGPLRLDQVQYDHIVEINVLTGDHGVNRPHAGRSNAAIDWVIVGGESGPNARPYDTWWAQMIIDQCVAAGVPCFHKQLGSNPFSSSLNGTMLGGGLIRLKDRKGGDMSEWPDALRVRQFPASSL